MPASIGCLAGAKAIGGAVQGTLYRDAVAARHPEAERGELRIGIVRQVHFPAESHYVVEAVQLILDFFGKFDLARPGLAAPAFGQIDPADQLIFLRPQIGQAALLGVVEARTEIGPASLLVLTADEPDRHGLNELLVAGVS